MFSTDVNSLYLRDFSLPQVKDIFIDSSFSQAQELFQGRIHAQPGQRDKNVGRRTPEEGGFLLRFPVLPETAQGWDSQLPQMTA